MGNIDKECFDVIEPQILFIALLGSVAILNIIVILILMGKCEKYYVKFIYGLHN